MNGAMLKSIIFIQCGKKYYLIFNVPLYYLYQLHCPGKREFCFAVLVWMWNVITCLSICPFQVALFGKGVELLGNGILLEKTGHCAWTSRFYNSATLSIWTSLPDCGCSNQPSLYSCHHSFSACWQDFLALMDCVCLDA